jgi:glycosyltransferase involved in cell wall biosynthesis
MISIPFKRFPAGLLTSDNQASKFDESFPNCHLVSCLMVTRGRIDLIRSAYASFMNQTWQRRELVIVCDGATDELRALASSGRPEVRLVEVQPGLSLGELRNISISRSTGEFVCQWDDDDLYDPNRIAISMKVLGDASVEAVFMNRWLIWWQSRERLAISPKRPWEGSMLARRAVVPIYPATKRGEDTVVADWIFDHFSVALFDYPQLYCYRVTDENTWNAEHFENIFARATRIFKKEEFPEVFKFPCFNSSSASSGKLVDRR